MTRPPRILAIAGSDSSGGAGIQADIKTITMLGGHAMTAVTAITAQNSRGVTGVHPVPVQMVLDQIEAVLSDIGVDAVKIGMIGSAETAAAVAELLTDALGKDGKADGVSIVFDPVMVATSGAVLADAATIAAFGQLMDIAALTTPNLPELEALGGTDAVLRHGTALLVKGGHAGGAELTDTLYRPGRDPVSWTDPRIDTPHTHGTGCTLSSAIAAYLGFGLPLRDAVQKARVYVRAALTHAPGYVAGNGPLGHNLGRDCFAYLARNN